MDLEAFQQRVIPLKNRLFRLACSMLQHSGEAEDAVQETLLKLWDQREDLDRVEQLDAWSLKVIRNHCLDCLKSKKRKRKTLKEMTFHQTETSTNPENQAVARDDLRLVRQLMDSLPEKQRSIMHLREMEEMSYREIADAMGISMEEVKVNLFRARNRIRKAYEKAASYEG